MTMRPDHMSLILDQSINHLAPQGWRAAIVQELRPRNQLESHPAAALIWLATVVLTVVLPVLSLIHRIEGLTALSACAILWLNVILGAWCGVRFRHWNWELVEKPPVQKREGSDPFDGAQSRMMQEDTSSSMPNRMGACSRSQAHVSLRIDDERLLIPFDSHCSLN